MFVEEEKNHVASHTVVAGVHGELPKQIAYGGLNDDQSPQSVPEVVEGIESLCAHACALVFECDKRTPKFDGVGGIENLPQEESSRYTFVCNHPLGAIDGVTLGAVLGKHYNGKVKYLVNDLLMNLRGLAPLCIPVNKMGKQARNLPVMVEEAFAGDNHIIMFPAGLCSRRIKGVIRDLDWSRSFINKSRKHHRDIVPIHFIGQNSNRFYTIANLCKWLHLPNFAMALLPDEMYRSRGKHYIVRIGQSIPYTTFDHTKTSVEWAEFVKQEVYKI